MIALGAVVIRCAPPRKYAKRRPNIKNKVHWSRVICKEPGDYIGWPTVARKDDGELLAVNDIGGGLWADFDVTGAVSSGTIAFGVRRAASDSNRSFDSLESGFAPELVIVYSNGSIAASVPALGVMMTVLLGALLLDLGRRRTRSSTRVS